MQKFILYGLLAGLGSLAGCHGGLLSTGPEKAEALVKPTRGNTVNGQLSFMQAGDKVRVVGEFSGLTPGSHGFHLHEKGDCSAPDGSSAGGHFNPMASKHGHPEQGEHHAGDMPQLVADARGVAKITVFLDGVKLRDLLGLSVIVHADADDFRTQPAGNAGPRQACGIVLAK